MKLHASGEDYLETFLVLQKKFGMVRSEKRLPIHLLRTEAFVR